MLTFPGVKIIPKTAVIIFLVKPLIYLNESFSKTCFFPAPLTFNTKTTFNQLINNPCFAKNVKFKAKK
jgi:hypothetical protein